MTFGLRAFGVSALGLVLSLAVVHGQTTTHYRDFQLGGDLTSVSALAGVAPSAARMLHARPAILQELEWRRPYAVTGATVDPVRQIAFSFYNDQLFRLVIDYDHDRTEGLTDADMVDAISAIYGTTAKPVLKTNRAPAAAIEDESGVRVAGWGDAEYSAVLYRSSYASAFRMVVTSVRLNELARTAEAQALRLDEREAPARERERLKKEADDAQASSEKARVANKAAFKP